MGITSYRVGLKLIIQQIIQQYYAGPINGGALRRTGWALN